MGSVEVTQSRVFPQAQELPRGRHNLSPDEVAESQRNRIMAALVELVAERSLSAVTIADVASRASVSRSAFYQHFADRETCLLAAYDSFTTFIIGRMTDALSGRGDDHQNDRGDGFATISNMIEAYLEALDADPPAARTFVVEMSAARGELAARQRETWDTYAEFLHQRHERLRRSRPDLGEVPTEVFLGFVLAVRGMVSHALTAPEPRPLVELLPTLELWAVATLSGATAARSALDLRSDP